MRAKPALEQRIIRGRASANALASNEHAWKRRRGARSVGTVGVILVALATLAGCTPNENAETPSHAAASVAPEVADARPLTQSEAEQLAVTRFRNFDAGTRALSASIPANRDGEQFVLTLNGWVDFASHRGYATLSETDASGTTTELGLVMWSTDNLAVRVTPVDTAPLPVPDDNWSSQALNPADSALSTALLLALNLGADRPENPQLLMQSDAAWIGTQSIDGVASSVFVGPSATPSTEGNAMPGGHGLDARSRYFVDKTGLLLRFDTRIGESSEWSRYEFSDADGVVLEFATPSAPPSDPPSAG